jgi:hypothetical protein
MLCHLFATMVRLQSKLEVREGVGAQAGLHMQGRLPIRRISCCRLMMRPTLFLFDSASKPVTNGVKTSLWSKGISIENSAEDLAHHGDVAPSPLSCKHIQWRRLC